MASIKMQTKYGKAVLFKNNPREIRGNQFNALTESLEQFPQFMDVQKVVLWKVPDQLDVGEGEKCPFAGQEGELIVLSGNQRVKGLVALGKREIPEEWCCCAQGKEGEWWNWRDASVFVNLANSPAGVSGDFDYEKLATLFEEASLRLSGIDFSEFQGLLDKGKIEPMNGEDEDGKTPEDDLEEGESGEKSEELADFISEREKTRANLKFIDETGFHLLAMFDTMEDKAKFVAESGLCGKGGRVAGNGTTYVDLVFETSVQKEEFAREAGLLCEDDEGDPRLMYGMFCDGRYIAEKMGIHLKPSMLKFRDRKLDTRLSAMAREEEKQKSVSEIEEAIYAQLKAERKALGMSTGSGGEGGKKRERKYAGDAADIGRGAGIYVNEE